MGEPRIPGYRVLQPIGRGGQATVYLAERTADRLSVALKLLDREARRDPVYLGRLKREYRLAATIEHPFVVKIYGHDFAGECAYIAMEFVPAGTLAGRMRGGIAPREALRLTVQIAQALDAIHAKDVLHRDLKPANILFRAGGEPVIVDFGLAKELSASSTFTVAGQLVATPRYMSPELCLNLPVDARSDLYSLGAMLYEMLTGEPLFGPADAAAVVNMHVNAPVPRLPATLAGYQGLLDRLLAKKPQERFQSARELFALIAP